MSSILTIYNTVAAMSVSADGKTPTTKDLDDLKDTYTSSDLPTRVLLPVGLADPSQASDGAFIALGDGAGITWQITDLLLWATVASGVGLVSVAAPLLEYSGAYVEALRTIRDAGIGSGYLQGWIVAPGTIEYPANSGHYYYGCTCVLSIREVLTS